MVIWVMKIIFIDSSVYSCHLFLIFSASVRSIPFLSFIVPIFAWNVPLVNLTFLKRCLVFPILLFPSISLNLSLGKAFLSLLAILWDSAFRWIYLSFSPFFLFPFFIFLLLSFHFSANCKASSDNHFALLHFFFSQQSQLPSPVHHLTHRVEASLLSPALNIKPFIKPLIPFFFFFFIDSEVVFSLVLNLGKHKPCRPLLMQPSTGHLSF